MSKPPITHLVIDTSSTDENYNGDCDFALVPMPPDYVEDLLWYMSEVARMRRAEESLYSIELWDATPTYFRWNLRLETVQDVYGDSAADVPRGEPILLAADPGFDREDFQEVECRTVQAAEDEVWWTAYVKHTNVRIETAHIPRKVLLEIRKRFPCAERGGSPRRPVAVHPAVRQIHDLLYLDVRGSQEFYNPDIMRTSGLCGAALSLPSESPVLLAIKGLGDRDVLRIIMASTYCPWGRKDGDHVGRPIRGEMGARQDACKPDRRGLGAVRRVPGRSRLRHQNRTPASQCC